MYLFVSNIIQYGISFFIKIHALGFYTQIWFKWETPLLFFLINTVVDRKKLFMEKIFSVKTIKLHVVHIWCHMQSE